MGRRYWELEIYCPTDFRFSMHRECRRDSLLQLWRDGQGSLSGPSLLIVDDNVEFNCPRQIFRCNLISSVMELCREFYRPPGWISYATPCLYWGRMSYNLSGVPSPRQEASSGLCSAVHVVAPYWARFSSTSKQTSCHLCFFDARLISLKTDQTLPMTANYSQFWSPYLKWPFIDDLLSLGVKLVSLFWILRRSLSTLQSWTYDAKCYDRFSGHYCFDQFWESYFSNQYSWARRVSCLLPCQTW